MAPHNDNVRVLRATRRHIDMLTELFDAYLTFYRREHTRDCIREYLSARMARKESAIFIALEGTGPETKGIGFAQLYPTFSSLRLSRMWVLNDLYTIPSKRRSGVAHLLLAAARMMAVGTSATHVELLTERTNHAAQRVYESVGYRRDECYYRYEQELVDAEHPAMFA